MQWFWGIRSVLFITIIDDYVVLRYVCVLLFWQCVNYSSDLQIIDIDDIIIIYSSCHHSIIDIMIIIIII